MLCALALAVASISFLSVQGVQHGAALLCLSNPLDRTASWPYRPPTRRLLLRYYDGPLRATGLSRSYALATRSATAAWSAAWPVLSFRRVPSAEHAQIIIEHGSYGIRGFWHDHAGLTVPTVDLLGCSLKRAVIEINDSYLVHNGQIAYPGPMLHHLLLHEIGHALGLHHVYGKIASVMVPTSDAYRFDRPQPYDVQTIASLYPLPKRRL